MSAQENNMPVRRRRRIRGAEAQLLEQPGVPAPVIRARDRKRLSELSQSTPPPGVAKNRVGDVIIEGTREILHKKGVEEPTPMGVYWKRLTSATWDQPLAFKLDEYGDQVFGNNTRWVEHKTERNARGKLKRRVLEKGSHPDNPRLTKMGVEYHRYHGTTKELIVSIPVKRYFFSVKRQGWSEPQEIMIAWVTEDDKNGEMIWIPNPNSMPTLGSARLSGIAAKKPTRTPSPRQLTTTPTT